MTIPRLRGMGFWKNDPGNKHRKPIALKLELLEHRLNPSVSLHLGDNFGFLPESPALSAPTPSLVFVDSEIFSSVPVEELANSLVTVIYPGRDGIGQISTVLADHTQVETVRIISHGFTGGLKLGGSFLTQDTLAARMDEITAWSKSLAPGADLLLYGCSIAANGPGRDLVQQLATVTSADVSASDDPTGADGDLLLEYSIGSIESGFLATPEAWGSSGLTLLLPNQHIGSGNALYAGSGVQFANEGAFAAIRTDGFVETWGDPAFGGDDAHAGSDVDMLISNSSAFTALRHDGSVISWGDPAAGGGSAPAGTGYHGITSNRSAFAALRSDGTIAAWGNAGEGGGGSPTGNGFVRIFSNARAFAALRADGTIVAWGDSTTGGSNAPTDGGYQEIFSTGYDFAALKTDGSITAWGDPASGATNAPTGTGFIQIASTGDAFAALNVDGTIAVWGEPSEGGVNGPTGSGFKQIFSTAYDFAALKEDGSIVGWGINPGIDYIAPPVGTGFTTISSNRLSYAALDSTGAIVAWGVPSTGGLGAPAGTGFTRIFSSEGAFAALKNDGTIAAWGDSAQGGLGAPTGAGFTHIYSNLSAFAATNADGSIAVWGDPASGGDNGPVGNGFLTVQSVMISPPYFPPNSPTSLTGSVGTEFVFPNPAVGLDLTCSILTGTLPPGLALDSSTGEITGIPTQIGLFSFTYQAVNPQGSSTRSFQMAISPDPDTVVMQPADLGAGSLVASLGNGKLLVKSVNGQSQEFFPFPGYAGPLNVNTVNRLGGISPDTIVVAVAGKSTPHVLFIDATLGTVLKSFYAFDPSFLGGVTVAGGLVDLGGQQVSLILCGAGSGSEPSVSVFNAVTGQSLGAFYAFDPAYKGGVRVALSEPDQSGASFAVVGSTINSHVVVFNLQNYQQALYSYYTFPVDQAPNGVFVAVGDLENDGLLEVLVGAGSGPTSPGVAIYGIDGTPKAPTPLNAFAPAFKGGVRVGLSDYNRDGFLDLLTVSGTGAPGTLNIWNYQTQALIDSVFISDSTNGTDVATNFSRGQG